MEACRTNGRDLQAYGIDIAANVFYEVESTRTVLAYHAKTITTLLRYSKGTAELVSRPTLMDGPAIKAKSD